MSGINDFAFRMATVNGTGSASANSLLMQAIFRMGIPVTGKNIFPSNIQGLPTFYDIRVSKDGYTARPPEIQRMRDELAASGLREKDPEAHRQRAFELGVAGYFTDPANAKDLTPFRVVGRVQQSVWESLGDFDLIRALKGIKIPSIVVSGRDDPIPLASSSEAASVLGTKLVLLDECGHVPYVEQPERLFAALDPFLNVSTPSVRS